jgi:hypothetical protein
VEQGGKSQISTQDAVRGGKAEEICNGGEWIYFITTNLETISDDVGRENTSQRSTRLARCYDNVLNIILNNISK